MENFEFLEPESLSEVLALLQERRDEVKLFAGGTALLQFLKLGFVRPAALISLRRIIELQGIQEDETGMRIGALVTHRDLEFSSAVKVNYPALWSAEARVGNARIRNMGTLAGNLCHADPNQDPPAALIAYGAQLRVVGPNGERMIAVEDFFKDYYENALEPAEVLVSIHLPPPGKNLFSAFNKFSPRVPDDFGTVTCGVALEINPETGICRSARLAVGCVHQIPWRSCSAEEILAGQKVTAEVAGAAAEAVATEVEPTSDIRGSEEYKRAMTRVIVARTIMSAATATAERIA